MFGGSFIRGSGGILFGIRRDVPPRVPHGWRLSLVLREKDCGWRIDVFYANEAMMKDILSSDIHNNVSLISHDISTDIR